CFVAAALHQDIEHSPVLIHRPPEIVPFAVDRQEDLIQMPLVTGSGTPAAKLIRILLPKLAAPLADGFVHHTDRMRKEQLFHIPVAKAEPVVEPDAMTDHLDRK